MGTKNNPGPIDCYAKALPDEPIFVLLGRDKHAPKTVETWVGMRQGLDSSPDAKGAEALAVATAMRQWRDAHGPQTLEGRVESDMVWGVTAFLRDASCAVTHHTETREVRFVFTFWPGQPRERVGWANVSESEYLAQTPEEVRAYVMRCAVDSLMWDPKADR